MKLYKTTLLCFLIMLIVNSCGEMKQNKKILQSENMMVRMSEIEIDSNYLDEYIAILKEESNASVKLEPGVISIYPMFQKENPNQIRILEIYADKEAYQQHLLTPHFKLYKTTTLKMVKSLKLIDMESIDAEAMSLIFKKAISKTK